MIKCRLISTWTSCFSLHRSTSNPASETQPTAIQKFVLLHKQVQVQMHMQQQQQQHQQQQQQQQQHQQQERSLLSPDLNFADLDSPTMSLPSPSCSLDGTSGSLSPPASVNGHRDSAATSAGTDVGAMNPLQVRINILRQRVSNSQLAQDTAIVNTQ